MTLNKIIKSESCLLVLALHHMNQRLLLLSLIMKVLSSVIYHCFKTDYLKPTLD